LSQKIAFLQNAQGSALAPFECWLLLRGMKTLAIRIKEQQLNCSKLIEWLANTDDTYVRQHVKHIYYPALKSSLPDKDNNNNDNESSFYAIHHRQALGGGSVFSFETYTAEQALIFVSSLELFKRTVSFGSVTSSISIPLQMSHASVPVGNRGRLRFGGNLIRVSVGIENIDDLIDDMRHAFRMVYKETEIEDD
jgi:cystathionine beta-lyase